MIGDSWGERGLSGAAVGIARHPEQIYFLARLDRLVRKTGLLERYLVPTDRRMRLLARAILATYEECATVGVRAEARAILGRAGH